MADWQRPEALLMEELTTWGMRFVGEEFHNDERDQIMMRRIATAVALLLSA